MVVISSFVFIIFTVLFHTGVADQWCYQCDSTLDSNCQEMWDHNLAINRQKYKVCDLWDAKYCIKVTGMWGGVVGTHRFCSSRDMGDQCQDIGFPDHDRLYRACVYTCSDDGCNSAPNWQRSWMGLCLGIISGVFMVALRYL
ncbi:hypothetical protein EGW08_010461 [Elysia chlorotica]|uniref:Protein sleepless n=1 Tax=Elysia chlorotica TaxID=188477 RepID=A0A3S0ZN94_ELYCH|nr:hypothetical protein EGW08_010461 [Elysia chlorotica]